MRILLAEDEVIYLSYLADKLIQHDHQVTPTSNGEECWKKFEENPEHYDLILTDLDMPHMDGLALLQKLRKEQYETPVMIMTAHDQPEISIHALRLGASDYLTKPFKIHELYEALTPIQQRVEAHLAIANILPYFSGQVQLTIPSQTKLIAGVVSCFYNLAVPFCQKYQIQSQHLDLCLYEAITNAVIHGNLEVPSSLKEESSEKFDALVKERELSHEFQKKTVCARFEITPPPTLNSQKKKGKMKFVIEDQGKGFDYTQLPDPNDPMQLLASGRGLMIIHSLMDEVSWNETGNCITIVKSL